MRRLIIVKKYSNRRLYDTDESRYITLDELATKIRQGGDIQVIDAKTGHDLTQSTLTQIILEGPTARLLPIPLLRQLIRMGDDAVAEFFGKYVYASLEIYLAAREGAASMTPYFPLANLPFTATQALLRLLGGGSEPAPSGGSQTDARSEVAELRRELEQLRAEMKGPQGSP